MAEMTDVPQKYDISVPNSPQSPKSDLIKEERRLGQRGGEEVKYSKKFTNSMLRNSVQEHFRMRTEPQ